MRVRKSYFFKIILNLLINQMHVIWEKRNYMIFLLLLNIINIFNQVISNHLVHVLHMKRILKKFTEWVCIYIINYIIILMLLNTKIKKNIMIAEVSQNSLLSLILYFFYIIKLLNICNNSNERLSMSTFMNNIILLTYKFFTEINYHTLIWAHNWCLNWAHRYDISFALKKYELIYLIY